MFTTTKFLLVCIILVYFFTTSSYAQKKKKNKNKFTGGKFIPGETQLFANSRRNGQRGGQQRRQGGVRGGPGGANHNNANAVNHQNYLNNLRNNNRVNGNALRPNAQGGPSISYPNVGKVTPPKRRTEGEKPPFAPSWTHCVITVQVSVGWVTVKSPHYPNKFQGQVQCSWIATAPEGRRVRLSFSDLHLLVPNNNGCGSQFVEIIDMDLQKSQARFCGTEIPGDYVSNGNKLRLDLQADAIATPYRGFMAAFRADNEVPGMRETSYFAHGTPKYLYNPLTESPESNPRVPAPTRRRIKVRTTTEYTIPGQNIYGAENQPHLKDDTKQESSESTPTTHLYIIIAVILVILLAAAGAYVFKRFFYKQFKAWRKKNKGVNEEVEMQKRENELYGNKQTILPGNMPLPPTPNQLATPGVMRRQTGMFNDEFYPENHMMQDGMHLQSRPPSYHSSFENLNRSRSFDDIANGWGQRADNEPIYEDDAMSLASVGSVRSSNRHPDHEIFKKQKILERQNSLRMRRNSIGSEIEAHAPQNGLFFINDPYRAHSLYGQRTYGYGPPGDVYGSLPPTLGPASNGIYPTFPMTSQPMYTSSMTNIAAGNSNNFMMQQYNGRSASVYDLTSAQPDMTSQWSTNLNQRHPSLTSSTNNSTSTNPILKKTTPNPQNELAFSALRSAKSMNDLTAINTKLNECVSWTLPSQRRKSFMDLP